VSSLLQHRPADAAPRLAGTLGTIDGVVIAEVWGAVDGWLVHPDHPVDRVRVRLNGKPLGEAEIDERPDVASLFPPVKHAPRCHYVAQGPVHELQGKPLYIEVIGLSGGREVIRAEDYWPGDDTLGIPVPDGDLRQRVSGSRSEASFRQSGYSIAGQLLSAVREFLPGVAQPRVLDWGCGSGRATRYMHLFWPDLPLTGCDIDAEAIGWCRQHIPGVGFDATGPFPPLPYPDGAFDAVVGSSVMTHLAAPVQEQWLKEIRRVLAPGGVFVTSVLGTLASVGLPEALRAVLMRDGIMDQKLDEALDGVAPANYYRSTYQSEAFTRRRWGRVLPVVAYRAGGLTNFQDLVVMRRDAAARSLWRSMVGG
jgi:SAM-dependent methyltransferase